METNHIGTMDGSETASETKVAIAGKVVVCVCSKWKGNGWVTDSSSHSARSTPITCPIAGKV